MSNSTSKSGFNLWPSAVPEAPEIETSTDPWNVTSRHYAPMPFKEHPRPRDTDYRIRNDVPQWFQALGAIMALTPVHVDGAVLRLNPGFFPNGRLAFVGTITDVKRGAKRPGGQRRSRAGEGQRNEYHAGEVFGRLNTNIDQAPAAPWEIFVPRVEDRDKSNVARNVSLTEQLRQGALNTRIFDFTETHIRFDSGFDECEVWIVVPLMRWLRR